MTRVSVFLSAVLLTASLGVAAQDAARKPGNAPPTNPQVSELPQASSSAMKDPAQKATTGDRTKRIETSGDGSEDFVQNGAPLPQTSTILPLLGFIGLGSLVAGLFARR
jgi:hypothetical protein